MKILLFFITIIAPLLLTSCTPHTPERVAVTLPAISSITHELTAQTHIAVVDFIPKDISIAELDQYMDEHPAVLDSAATCDAVFDLRSVIPEDIAYLELRHRNIRIIESDCAAPLDAKITPIPLIDAPEGSPHYVWLSVSNVMKMAEIASKDLSLLYPHDSTKIRTNLASLKKRYFALKSDYETKFAEVPDFSACEFGGDFDYFLKDINLFVTERYPADETSWPNTTTADFTANIASGSIKTVVHRWKPTGDIGATLDAAHVPTAVLVVGDPALHAYDNGLFGLIESNSKALLSALTQSTKL